MNSNRSFIFVIVLALVGAVIIGAIVIVSLTRPAAEGDATEEVVTESTAEATEEATEQVNGETPAEATEEAVQSENTGETTEEAAQSESTAEATEETTQSDGSGTAQPGDESASGAATPTSRSRVRASIVISAESTTVPPATVAANQPAQTGGNGGEPTPTSLSRVQQSIILGEIPSQQTTPEEQGVTGEITEEAMAEGTQAAGAEATGEATEQAEDAGETGEFLTVDEQNQTVNLTIIAAYDNTNGGLNFNGYANGNATVTVPEGWTVNVTFENRSNLPHSVMVVPEDSVSQTSLPEPVFEGAATADPEGGTTSTREFSFTAAEAGTYAMACGVLGHAQQGQWIFLEVGSSDVEPAFTTDSQ